MADEIWLNQDFCLQGLLNTGTVKETAAAQRTTGTTGLQIINSSLLTLLKH